MTHFRWTCALFIGALGCGKSAVVPAKFADAQSSISAATAVGAERNPQGALHLKMARDQLQQAQSLSADGKNEEARLVLERAQADAELALMLTREEGARAEARKAEQDVQELSKPN